MAAIWDSQFAKKKKKKKTGTAFLEERSYTILYQIHSEDLENWHFQSFAILSNSGRWPLGLPMGKVSNKNQSFEWT